jgi:hypothetical protein
MNDKLEKISKKPDLAQSRYCPGTCMEELRKNHEELLKIPMSLSYIADPSVFVQSFKMNTWEYVSGNACIFSVGIPAQHVCRKSCCSFQAKQLVQLNVLLSSVI